MWSWTHMLVPTWFLSTHILRKEFRNVFTGENLFLKQWTWIMNIVNEWETWFRWEGSKEYQVSSMIRRKENSTYCDQNCEGRLNAKLERTKLIHCLTPDPSNQLLFTSLQRICLDPPLHHRIRTSSKFLLILQRVPVRVYTPHPRRFVCSSHLIWEALLNRHLSFKDQNFFLLYVFNSYTFLGSKLEMVIVAKTCTTLEEMMR